MKNNRGLLFLFIILLIFAIYITNSVTKNNIARKGIVVNSHKWDKLLLVLDQIEKNYVDTIDYHKFVEDILPDVLGKLDPHSIYLSPEQLKESEEPLVGNFSGIGIQFNVPNDTAVVISVISGGPSEKVGLLSGDRIIKIDGKVVAGVKFPQDSLVKMLKGPTGTEVNIEVKRDDLKDLLPFKIERGKIPIKALDVALMLNDTIGYVKISKFGKTTYQEFVEATNNLRKLGLKDLILDLRDNTGGHLDQAFMISNEFLNSGDLIVYLEGENTERENYYADGKGRMKDIGLNILINENSASSSEIVAGAIQDNDRGTIVGRRSYGKGLVQKPIYFSDNSGIRLTIARYYTPTGRCVQKPYNNYEYDLIERYKHGELLIADSIKINDSLKFTTPKGKIVYGGGGIIPDVFVPIDTVGVTNFLINVNRRSLIIKYSNILADIYRKDLRKVKTIDDLNNLYSKIDIENSFLNYAQRNGVSYVEDEWKQSKFIIIQQLKALVGRYSELDDRAFYTYFLEIDNVIDTIKDKFGINKQNKS